MNIFLNNALIEALFIKLIFNILGKSISFWKNFCISILSFNLILNWKCSLSINYFKYNIIFWLSISFISTNSSNVILPLISFWLSSLRKSEIDNGFNKFESSIIGIFILSFLSIIISSYAWSWCSFWFFFTFLHTLFSTSSTFSMTQFFIILFNDSLIYFS